MMERVNKQMRKRHIEVCKGCKYHYDMNEGFCTVFQKSIGETSLACDGTDDVIETLL